MNKSRNLRSDRRGLAALEFGLIAPLIIFMLLGAYDISRGFTIWAQTKASAQTIALAAEKLAVTPDLSQTTLTATQMQNAMSAIYAQIPGLNLGTNGSFGGAYAVTLSSVVYLPLCQTTSGCAPQKPYVLWSTYLTEGGPQLDKVPTKTVPLTRACGALTQVAAFPNDNTQLTKMLDPTMVANGVSMTLNPQLVVDVWYTYTPMFSKFITPMTFYASTTVPAPLGGMNQEVTFNTSAGNGNVVSCNPPN